MDKDLSWPGANPVPQSIDCHFQFFGSLLAGLCPAKYSGESQQ
jgi:hypothetical protein